MSRRTLFPIVAAFVALPLCASFQIGTSGITEMDDSPLHEIHHPTDSRCGGTETDTTPFSENGYQQLYMRFTENRGQYASPSDSRHADILFMARIPGARLYLTKTGFKTVFSSTPASRPPVSEATGRSARSPFELERETRRSSQFVTMSFLECNPEATVTAHSLLPGYENFYLPQCPEGITHVPAYRSVRYQGLYAGIDLRYYGAEPRAFNYDFVVHPGADPSLIRMEFSGADRLYIDHAGALHIATACGEQLHHPPRCFTADGAPVSSTYRIESHTVSVMIGKYDHTQTLFMGSWGLIFGGSHEDFCDGLACSPDNEIALLGSTFSDDLPAEAGYQSAFNGELDAVLAVFHSGGELRWATYLGGSDRDVGGAVVWDTAKEICITGTTQSVDFPHVNAYQAELASGKDMFVTKFSANGTLIWSTFLGGSTDDIAHDLTVSTGDALLITGATKSPDFPSITAHQPALAGEQNCVLTRLSPAGQPIWSTFFGGSASDISTRVRTDANGNIYMTGETTSKDFPIAEAYQTALSGDRDMFVSKWTTQGRLLWATYYGGSSTEYCRGLTVHSDGACTIVGETASRNLPIAQACQGTYAGNSDGAIARFGPEGDLLCATFLGGSDWDALESVSSNAEGDIVVSGLTKSNNLKTLNALRATPVGGTDLIIASYHYSRDAGYQPSWLSYFGSPGWEQCGDIMYTGDDFICFSGCGQGDLKEVFEWVRGSRSDDFSYELFLITLTGNGTLAIGLPTELPASPTLLSMWPVPARDEVRITFLLSYPAAIEFHLFDCIGRRITCLEGSRQYSAGVHTQNLALPRLVPGGYILEMSYGQSSISKLVVIH